MGIYEHISDMKKNALIFDAVKMKLRQNTSSDPVSFHGKGFIAQDSDGSITFKIYTESMENTDAVSHAMSFLQVQPGQVYGDENYYDLTFLEADGTEWSATDILPSCAWSAASHFPIVTGSMQKIHTLDNHSMRQGFATEVWFFHDLELPVWPSPNQAAEKIASFEAAGYSFNVRQQLGELIVRADSESDQAPNVATHIQEALMFLTAKPLAMRVLKRIGPGGVEWDLISASRRSNLPQTGMHPPLGRSDYEFQGHGWRLFSCYFEYLCGIPASEYWSHLTYYLQNAVESSANSIDSWAVGTSVAVEGMVSLVGFTSIDARADHLDKFRKWLLPQDKKNEEFADLLGRLGGILKSMNNVRVQDRLIDVVANGYADSAYVAAWVKLRNKHVHPKATTIPDISISKHQTFMDLIYKTTTLLYQIAFYITGHKGPYRDFGTPGFPIRNYPYIAPTEPSAETEV